MDCICCGFGAVLLLFILTAKKQIIVGQEEALQSREAAATLEAAIEEAEARRRALVTELEALDPQPDADTTSFAELAAREERLAREVEAAQAELQPWTRLPRRPRRRLPRIALPPTKAILPGCACADRVPLSCWKVPGSMLGATAEEALNILQQGSPQRSAKWDRARAALRAVLAAIPKGTEVAVLQMGENTTALSGTAADPYIDPYDNQALLRLLGRLEALEATGGADLVRGLQTVKALPERPSSVLLIGDGLPTAPAPGGRGLSESERVRLFNQAVASRPNAPFNAILFPFAGDPSAAGLFWQLSGQTNGITLIPDEDWPQI